LSSLSVLAPAVPVPGTIAPLDLALASLPVNVDPGRPAHLHRSRLAPQLRPSAENPRLQICDTSHRPASPMG
jgi:hypothetical protein